MLNIAKTTGNTSTGVHMLQRYKGGFRIRCDLDTVKRFTSVDVRPEHVHLFGHGDLKIYHSQIFATIPEGAQAVCAFIETVCGTPCQWKP